MRAKQSASLGISAVFLIAAGIGFSCTSGDDNAAPDQSDASTGSDATSGDASPSDSSSPTDANLIDAGPPTAILAGGENSCFLRNGVLKCWGANDEGNLANGEAGAAIATPTIISGVSPLTAAIGGHHMCASSATTTWCWGLDIFGMLGFPLDAGSGCGARGCGSPQVVPSLVVSRLGLADFQSCAIATGGTVSCWGLDERGELGFLAPDGSPIASGDPYVPKASAIPGITGATEIAVGLDAFQCILQSSPGPVTCWGADYEGYLGGNPADAAPNVGAPAAVAGITNATAITAGEDHLCALLADKTVMCWGANTVGQLGHDPAGDPLCGTVPCNPTPTAVAGLSGVVAISSDFDFTCALKSDGSVMCWGDDSYGQLNVDPSVDDAGGGQSFQATPVTIAGLPAVAQIAVGWFHACALTVAGDVYCWGDDQYDQLGVAGHTFTPVKIEGL